MNKFLNTLKTIVLKMHFWLPLVYTVIFWLVAAATQTTNKAGLFYVIGLAITLVLSTVLTYLTSNSIIGKGKSEPQKDELNNKIATVTNASTIAFNRSEDNVPDNIILPSSRAPHVDRGMSDEAYRKIEKEAERLKKEKELYADTMKGQPDSNMNTNYLQPQRMNDTSSASEKLYRDDYMQPETMRDYYGEADNEERESRAAAARHELYPDSPETIEVSRNIHNTNKKEIREESNPQFTPYVQPHNAINPNSIHLEDYEKRKAGEKMRVNGAIDSALSSSIAATSDMPNGKSSEKPIKIYRTKQNPNVLIYEYPDCYETYFVKPDGSLEYLKTEDKN